MSIAQRLFGRPQFDGESPWWPRGPLLVSSTSPSLHSLALLQKESLHYFSQQLSPVFALSIVHSLYRRPVTVHGHTARLSLGYPSTDSSFIPKTNLRWLQPSLQKPWSRVSQQLQKNTLEATLHCQNAEAGCAVFCALVGNFNDDQVSGRRRGRSGRSWEGCLLGQPLRKWNLPSWRRQRGRKVGLEEIIIGKS